MEIRPPPARTKIGALACYAIFVTFNNFFRENGVLTENKVDLQMNVFKGLKRLT